MPAFFFVIAKQNITNTREYMDMLRGSVLTPDSFSKMGAIEVNKLNQLRIYTKKFLKINFS